MPANNNSFNDTTSDIFEKNHKDILKTIDIVSQAILTNKKNLPTSDEISKFYYILQVYNYLDNLILGCFCLFYVGDETSPFWDDFHQSIYPKLEMGAKSLFLRRLKLDKKIVGKIEKINTTRNRVAHPSKTQDYSDLGDIYKDKAFLKYIDDCKEAIKSLAILQYHLILINHLVRPEAIKITLPDYKEAIEGIRKSVGTLSPTQSKKDLFSTYLKMMKRISK